MTEKLSSASVRHIQKEVPVLLGDFKITAFEVPHDGTDNVGYCVEVGGKVFSFHSYYQPCKPFFKLWLRWL